MVKSVSNPAPAPEGVLIPGATEDVNSIVSSVTPSALRDTVCPVIAAFFNVKISPEVSSFNRKCNLYP